MSKIATDSYVARRMAQTASLKAAAEVKRIRNDAASEREHLRLMRKVEREFDGSLGRGGILKRGLARISSNSLIVPAERKRQLISSTSGRSFHGKGATYSKGRATTTVKGRKRAASSGAAHYRYIGCAEHDSRAAAGPTGSHVSYIDGSRVEKTGEGERLARSNIDGDFVDRMRFFELAEAFERNSHGDKASLDLNRASAELAGAIADPACDPALRAAVEDHPLPHNGPRIKIQLKGNNQDLRRLLTKHGMMLSKAKKNDDRLEKDGIAFHSGRSGRTHFRWVFELPAEFTAKQREQVLDALCARMDELKCMYAAVIHAPDPGNDEKNFHLHLIFYDRLCRRLTGTEADLDNNVAERFKDDIRKDIAAGHIKAGEWDFTVERHYKSIRTWKTHYPFRAEKSREVTSGKDWKKRFRCGYAAIVNKVSAESGGPTLYDPRSYEDRDVNIAPSKHLGQLHASEVAGIPTIIGLSNEGNQANDERRAILSRLEAEKARLDALELKLAPYLATTAPPLVLRFARKPAEDIADARLALEARTSLELWRLETARERSRAVLVRDRQRRAAEKGPARERRDRGLLADAAEVHLATLDKQDAEMQHFVAGLQRDLERSPTVTEASIDKTVGACQVFDRQFRMAAHRTQGANAQDAPVSVPAKNRKLETAHLAGSADTPARLEQSGAGADAVSAELTAATLGQVTAGPPMLSDPGTLGGAISSLAVDASIRLNQSNSSQQAAASLPASDAQGEASRKSAENLPTSHAPIAEDRPSAAMEPVTNGSLGRERRLLIVPPLDGTGKPPAEQTTVENTGLVKPSADHSVDLPTDVDKTRSDQVAAGNPALQEMSDGARVTLPPALPSGDAAPGKSPQERRVQTSASVSFRLAQRLAQGPDPEINRPLPPWMKVSRVPVGAKPANASVNFGLAQRLAQGPDQEINRPLPTWVKVGRVPVGAKPTRLRDLPSSERRNETSSAHGSDVPIASAAGSLDHADTGRVIAESSPQSSVPQVPVPVEGKLQSAGKAKGSIDDIAEHDLLKLLERIDGQQLRLAIENGQIVAAQGQKLDPGDAIWIAKAQQALRPVKLRQDMLAVAVAKDLWLNADQLLTGRTDSVDKLTLELKDKWARDPAIAWARARMGLPASPAVSNSHQAAFVAGHGEGVA